FNRLEELGIDEKERGTRLQHAKWMCKAANGINNELKLHRWLGFVQAWLVAENIFSLDECMSHMRALVRDRVNGVDSSLGDRCERCHDRGWLVMYRGGMELPAGDIITNAYACWSCGG